MEVIRKTCSYGSPDLTGFDFFFSGYIKNAVYADKIRDLQHLKDRIYADIETSLKRCFLMYGRNLNTE
jgi:hypothetical protein